jgi:tetratricopeptide (TPR) repeat protein
MSIINNVLKDLESRSSHFKPIRVKSVERVAATSSNFIPGLLTFILLLVVGLFFWFYKAPIQSLDKAIDSVTSEALINESEALKVIAFSESDLKEKAQKDTNKIIGMQFRESNDAISLEFSLHKKVVSYLKKRSNKEIIYYLKDIENEIIAPVILDNRWVKTLEMTAQTGGLDISLVTWPNTLVETQQTQLGEEIVWTITLRKQPDPIEISSIVSSQTTQPVITDIRTQLNVKAVIKDVVNASKKTKLVKLEIKATDNNSDTVRQLKKAQILIKQKKLLSAENLLLGLLDSAQDLSVRESLVLVYKRAKKRGRLNELVKESINQYPNNHVFRTSHAQSLFEINAYQSVIDFLIIQTELNAVQLALTGASYQRLDQHQTAANFYRKSLQVEPAQPRNWIALGLSEEHNGNLKQALLAYRSATKQGVLNTKLTEFVEERSRILQKVIN